MNDRIMIILILSFVVVISYTSGFLLGLEVGKKEAKDEKTIDNFLK